MAIIKAVSSGASIGRVIEYVSREEKTKDERLLLGINIYNPNKALPEMKRVKQFYGKEGGREYKHYVYSFSPEESKKITLEQIRDNAVRLVKSCPELKGYQVLIVVHDDKEHKHAHIIINSVNARTGEKLRVPKKFLENLKDRCNEISLEQGLSVPQKSEEITTWNKYEYQSIERGESWKMNIAQVVEDALAVAKSKEEFERICNEHGVGVKYLHDDKRKNVTYFDTECRMVRDTKLAQTFKTEFGKERIDNEIRRNVEREQLARRAEQTLDNSYRAFGRRSEELERTMRAVAGTEREIDGVIERREELQSLRARLERADRQSKRNSERSKGNASKRVERPKDRGRDR